MDNRAIFAERLRVAAAKAGLSRVEIADRLGVTRPAVHRWFHGTAAPTAEHLQEICDLTGCSLAWLMLRKPVDIVSTRSALPAEDKGSDGGGEDGLR